MKTYILTLGTFLLCTAGSLSAAALDTNAASPAAAPAPAPVAAPAAAPLASAPAATGSRPGFAAFELITQRNIFDPRRQPGVTARDRGPFVAPPRVETITLTGTTRKLAKGYDAFFTGAGVRTAVQDVGDMVNEFKIKAIDMNGVDLINTKSPSNEVVTVGVTHGLTRLNGGEWKNAYPPIPYSSAYAARAPQDDNSQYTPRPTFMQDDNMGNNFASRFQQQDDTGNIGRNRGFNNNTGFGNQGGGFNQGGGGQGRGGRRNRGGAAGNNGDDFGGGGAAFAAPAETSSAPAAVDPAVLARLQAKRAQEEKGN